MQIQFKKKQYANLLMLGTVMITMAHAQQNQRFFTGDNTSAEEFSKVARMAERATRDLEDLPASASLKKYAPVPGNQGHYGTCVAWSTAYAARTISYCIKHHIEGQDHVMPYAFSPGYLYYYIKKQADDNCSGGASLETAMNVLVSKGNSLLAEKIPDCVTQMDAKTDEKAVGYTIKTYTRLTESYASISKNELNTIKKSLSEGKPVVMSLKCMNSFFGVATDGIWKPAPVNDAFMGNHAMCIIGYDDAKQGGAFEVMNSWGTNWGNRGTVWLTYEQMMQFGNYAVEMMDREAEQPEIKGSMDFVLLDSSTMPVVRSRITTRSISVEDDEKADYSSYHFKENYPGGTAFKIKLSINAPVFVYIFSVDDKGTVSKLFPYAPDISAAINSANATVYLPSEKKHARLSNDPGSENICVIYSKKEIDFNGLINSIGKAPGKMYDTIMDTFKEKMIPVKKIEFANDNINFSTKAGEDELVCFFMNMSHK